MKSYSCHKIARGQAEGKVVISSDPICFYLVDPESGVVIERDHDLEGVNIANKIIIFPGGKGSSVVQADGLYQLQLQDNAPCGMIIKYPDTVLVATSIIMDIPLVDRVEEDFYSAVEIGDLIELNADQESIKITDKS